MIISIEGIDGAGKNTLVTALARDMDATVIAFPRYDDHVEAQLARQALYNQMGDLVDSVNGMAVLFALDRYRAKDELVAFQPGGEFADRLLILDRYVASNAAYSVARTGDEGLAQWVADVEFDRLGLPIPDVQVLLATDADEAQLRATKRAAENAHRAKDAYESDFRLQEATVAAYRRLADSNWYSPWVTVDTTSCSIDEAIAAIKLHL